MKAAVLREYNQPLELVDCQVPEVVRADEVRVRIEAAGVCATDVHAIEGHMEAAGVKLPRVLGHENAGRVEAVGELVSTVSVGDPVLIYPPFSCGLCAACRRGEDIHCDHHDFVGLSLDGGFAEYLVVRERSLVPLPADVDLVEIAPHADAGITAYHAVRRLAPLLLPGRTTVVLGVGGVGHIGLQLVRELGASRVVAVDPNESRRQLAAELGADEVLDSAEVVDAVRELTDGRGADVILDFVGTQQTHDDSLTLLAKGGRYGIVGYGGTIAIPSVALVAQEQAIAATLVGNWTDLWEVLQMHHAGRLVLKTETAGLEQINEVLDRLREGQVTGRAVLTPRSDGPSG